MRLLLIRKEREMLVRSLVVATVGLGLWLVCGCATTGPYEYGQFHPGRPAGTDVTAVAIEYGTPNKTLDGIGNILGIPAKVLSLNSKVDNHHVSDETIEKLTAYLEKNDLTDVRVSVNQYSPRDQWRRLRENDRISPGWRYTAGTLGWMSYTIRPGRLFGGTEYNPFTNTLYVNSDVPALLLAEAAYAKDIHGRKFPGAYAVFANGLPVVSIWRQSRAVSDVLGYARAEQDWDVEKQTYRVMYPQIGASAFGGAGVVVTGSPGSLTSFVVGPLLGTGGAVAGHAAGRTISNRRESELKHAAACNGLLMDTERPIPSTEHIQAADVEVSGEKRGNGKMPIVQTSFAHENSDVATGEKGSFDSDDGDEGPLGEQR